MPVLKAYCNICNLWLNSHTQLVAHQTGRSHKRREVPGSTNLSSTSQIIEQARSYAHIVANQENNSKITPLGNIQDDSEMQRDDNAGQNNTCRTKNQNEDEQFCSICVVQLTSRSQADMHYLGLKHKKALAVLTGKVEDEGVTSKSEDVCEICNVQLSSKAVVDAHYAGSKHEKKMKLSQSIRAQLGSSFSSGDNMLTTSSTTSLALITRTPSQMASSSSILVVPVPPGLVGQQRKGPVGSYLYCSFCGVSVNSQQQMDAHWHGIKHKNNVNGFVPQHTARSVPNHSRHIYSHANYGPSNGQAVFRTGQSLPYVSHQF